ncbi:MAG TPA: RNA 2'-phosphotransferase [Galbitalea sp.]|nr:RNA 2'-phosphotransferase [Galbitalea sp.]
MKPDDLSRAVSHALRHDPSGYGLELDSEGWVEISDLLTGLRARGSKWTSVDENALDLMISNAAKQRFEIDGSRIRAFYGHSVEGQIARPIVDPPDVLFHGTSPDAWQSIQAVGLLPMSRQSVHLSIDETTAAKVGARKTSTPIVLTVDARAAQAAGIAFSLGNENAWVATAIPPQFIALSE